MRKNETRTEESHVLVRGQAELDAAQATVDPRCQGAPSSRRPWDATILLSIVMFFGCDQGHPLPGTDDLRSRE